MMAHLKDILPMNLKAALGGLSDGELKFLDDLTSGRVANFFVTDQESDAWLFADGYHRALYGLDWGHSRTIRPELIEWVLSLSTDKFILPRHGVRIKGAKIVGKLDLSNSVVRVPLELQHCCFTEKIDASSSQLNFLSLCGSLTQQIEADAVQIAHDLDLEDIWVEGGISLQDSRLGQNLICRRGIFRSLTYPAFNASGMILECDIVSDQATYSGGLELVAATIKGAAVFRRCYFDDLVGQYRDSDDPDRGSSQISDTEPRSFSLNLEESRIEHELIIEKQQLNPRGRMSLRGARCGEFWSDRSSWPIADSRTMRDPYRGVLLLDGFEYSSIGTQKEGSTTDVDYYVEVLSLLPSYPFRPQPYSQLAAAYRRMGHEDYARTILIKKEVARRKFADLKIGPWAVNWFLDFSVGYGYRLWRSLCIMACIVLAGALVFSRAFDAGILVSTKQLLDPLGSTTPIYNLTEDQHKTRNGSDSPINRQFSPLAYSVDLFIPFLDLSQVRFWVPDMRSNSHLTESGCCSAVLVRLYYWFHISVGWLFSTLVAASLVGLVKRE